MDVPELLLSRAEVHALEAGVVGARLPLVDDEDHDAFAALDPPQQARLLDGGWGSLARRGIVVAPHGATTWSLERHARELVDAIQRPAAVDVVLLGHRAQSNGRVVLDGARATCALQVEPDLFSLRAGDAGRVVEGWLEALAGVLRRLGGFADLLHLDGRSEPVDGPEALRAALTPRLAAAREAAA